MQQRKNVIFIADSLDNAHKFQAVLSSLDVDVAAGSSMQFKKLLADNPSYDLVIYEATAESAQTLRSSKHLSTMAACRCSSS